MCVLPSRYVCDGLDHCVTRKDECEIDCIHSFVCDKGETCLDRAQFCDGEKNCNDGTDEKTVGFGFKCEIRQTNVAKTCLLPQSMVLDEVYDCNDRSDTCSNGEDYCFRCLTVALYLSTKQVCDGVFDCPDFSDECLCEKNRFNNQTIKICKKMCLDVSAKKCENCQMGQLTCDDGLTCIRTNQYCNGKDDCQDGSDEKSCSDQIHKQFNETLFKNFECPDRDETVIECDRKLECLDYSDECSLKNSNVKLNSSELNAWSDYVCGTKTLPICFELSNLIRDEFGYYHYNGLPLIYEAICNGVEEYLITPNTASTELENVRSWQDFTFDERYCDERFLCQHSRPKDTSLVTIHKSQVCDGNIDCFFAEDESEELCSSVTRRFYCESHRMLNLDTINRTWREDSKIDPLFIEIFYMFDGKQDCLDGSDECPLIGFADNLFSSKSYMIKDIFLGAFVWVVAFVALAGNSVVIWHNSHRLLKQRLNPMMRTNSVLLLNLALSDFLMGIYLLVLASKNAETSGSYCNFDKEWRSSVSCRFLGTLAMLSIQSSILFLIILTTYRMLAVLRPFSANCVNERLTCILIVGAWLLALVVAVLPNVTTLENYFITSAWISTSAGFFATDTPNKESLNRFALTLLALKGTESNMVATLQPHDYLWKSIRYNLNQFYPSFWPQFKIKGYFGFYSSNSVCLPQMFVKTDHRSWAYAVSTVICNLIACVYVALAYCMIYSDAKRVAASKQNEDENRTMQARITRLILTDFACWLPVSVMALLSLSGVNIPLSAYAYTAVILLPINSALNPILYSNVTTIIYNSYLLPAFRFLSKSRNRRRNHLSRNRSQYSRTSMTTNDSSTHPDSRPMIPQQSKSNSESSQNLVSTSV